MRDKDSFYAYTYDNLDRAKTITFGETTAHNTFAGYSLVYDYGSRADGLIDNVKATFAGTADFMTKYGYDENMHVNKITQSSQTGHDNVAYKDVSLKIDADGRLQTVFRYGSAVSPLVSASKYEYDADGRLVEVWHAADLNALDNATALAHYHQHYNEQQRLDDLSISQSGKSFTDLAYTYDNSGQLTDVSKHVADLSSSEAYRYDQNGNRTSANGATYTPPNAGDLNRLQNDGEYAYTYTAFGERATRTMLDASGHATLEHTVYTWDNRHRLTDVAVYASSAYLGNATKTIHYTYDVFNQLILTQVTNVTEFTTQTTFTQFVHDRGECVLTNRWTVGDGVLPPPTLTRFLYGPETDQLLAIEVSTSAATSGTVYWAYSDYLGTVRELRTNTNERVSWRDFDSFGNIIAEERSATFTAAMPVAFTGRWWDADSRLYQYRARWYDPHTGEFLSPDPIQDDFNNTYRYVGNGPTDGADSRKSASIRIAIRNGFIKGSEIGGWTSNPGGRLKLLARSFPEVFC